MQTILGSNGQIGRELALSLKHEFTDKIRLVSRDPKRVNPTDELFKANLLDAGQTLKAVEGSEVVYLTVGSPRASPTSPSLTISRRENRPGFFCVMTHFVR